MLVCLVVEQVHALGIVAVALTQPTNVHIALAGCKLVKGKGVAIHVLVIKICGDRALNLFCYQQGFTNQIPKVTNDVVDGHGFAAVLVMREHEAFAVLVHEQHITCANRTINTDEHSPDHRAQTFLHINKFFHVSLPVCQPVYRHEK